MANLSWLKIVPYFVIAGLAWWALDSEYTRGTEFEIAKCESEKAKADIDAMKELGKLRKELDAERDKADTRATQIIGAYANEIEKLNADLNSVNDKRLYISAKAASCEADRNGAPSSDQSSGQPSAEIRFEIPSPLGRAIRGDYFTAAGLEMRYNMLVDLIESRPDCFEKVR